CTNCAVSVSIWARSWPGTGTGVGGGGGGAVLVGAGWGKLGESASAGLPVWRARPSGQARAAVNERPMRIRRNEERPLLAMSHLVLQPTGQRSMDGGWIAVGAGPEFFHKKGPVSMFGGGYRADSTI